MPVSIKSFFNKNRIDWSKATVCPDSSCGLSYNYPITPWKFLEFAEEDLKEGKTRGLVNALSNAKRAIDCQVDSTITALGYTPNRLHTQLGKDLVRRIDARSSNLHQPLTFRLLESFGIITPSIIGKMRKLRHLLEHHYKKPPKAVVCDAIDVAKLFIRATERMLMVFQESFSVSSGTTKFLGIEMGEKTYHMTFHAVSPQFIEVVYWDREKIKKQKKEGNPKKSPRIKVHPTDALYHPLLQLAFSINDKVSFDLIFASLVEAMDIEPKPLIKNVKIEYF